jgi:hypothetical protein
MKRLQTILTIVLCLFLSVNMVLAEEKKESFKIGVVLPMSPPGAYASGNPMWWAAREAAEAEHATPSAEFSIFDHH